MRRTFVIIGTLFGLPALLLLSMAALGAPAWFGPEMANASLEAEVALHIGYIIGAITLLAIAVAVAAIFAQRQTARANATITHLTNMELDNDFLEAKLEFLELVSSNEIMQYADKEKVHTEQAQKIRIYLNHFEMISLGIQHGIIDYEIFKKWNKSTVLLVWAKSCPFVMEMRKQFHNTELFVEFEELVKDFGGNRRRRFR